MNPRERKICVSNSDVRSNCEESIPVQCTGHENGPMPVMDMPPPIPGPSVKEGSTRGATGTNTGQNGAVSFGSALMGTTLLLVWMI